MNVAKFNKIFIANFQIQRFKTVGNIVIPNKVKRDNLSILKAIASVTKKDYEAPNYQYVDDPFLIPYTGIDKKVFSLSLASGRDAARYVMNRYPNLFKYSPAQHYIGEYMPVDPSSPLPIETLDGLRDRIEMMDSLGAYDSYMKNLDAGNEIPRSILDDLLDLLCYSNAQPLKSPPNPDVSYFKSELTNEEDGPMGANVDGANRHLDDVWRDEGPAEGIYKEIQDKSIRNICSIIRGRIKFLSYESGLEEYNKYKDNDMHFDVGTYNSVLSAVPHVRHSLDEAWELTLETLKEMKRTETYPNFKTFNNVLWTLSTFVGNNFVAGNNVVDDVSSNNFVAGNDVESVIQHRMFATINEMKKCGIEPSLTTWYHVLQICYGSPTSRNRILYDIVNELSQSDVTIQESSDYQFFSLAMAKCLRCMRSATLALKLNDLVVEKGWEHMLGDSKQTSHYYTNFLISLCYFDNLDTLMTNYNKLVPHTYTPTYKVLDCVLKSIEQHSGYEHIPKIWNDMMVLKYTKRPDLIERLLDVVANSTTTSETDEKLQRMYVAMVDSMVEQFLDDKESKGLKKPFQLTGNMVNSMIDIVLNSNLNQKAWDLFILHKENSKSISTFISEKALANLCRVFTKENDYEKVHAVVSLMAEFGFESADVLVDDACKQLDVDDEKRARLKSLLQSS